MVTKKKSKRPAWRTPKKRARPKRHKPETLRVRSISPSFTVNDLQRSIAWYREVLGCTEGEHWEQDGQLRGVQMKAGNCDIMLGQDDFAKGRDRKKGEGLRIWVTTVQDVDALAAQIKTRGGTLDHEPQDLPWGDRAFAISDPDGFKLTVVRER